MSTRKVVSAFYNQRYLELLDLPAALLEGRPRFDDLARLQLERGDFLDGYMEIDSFAAVRQPFDLALGLRLKPIVVHASCMFGAPRRAGISKCARMLPDGGWVRTFTDVTDYMAAQEAMRQSEARWRSLTQLSSDWYWEQDAELRFVRLEGRAQGHARPEAPGLETLGTAPCPRQRSAVARPSRTVGGAAGFPRF